MVGTRRAVVREESDKEVSGMAEAAKRVDDVLHSKILTPAKDRVGRDKESRDIVTKAVGEEEAALRDIGDYLALARIEMVKLYNDYNTGLIDKADAMTKAYLLDRLAMIAYRSATVAKYVDTARRRATLQILEQSPAWRKLVAKVVRSGVVPASVEDASAEGA